MPATKRARVRVALLATLAAIGMPLMAACGSNADNASDSRSSQSADINQGTNQWGYEAPSNKTYTEIAGRRDNKVWVFPDPVASRTIGHLTYGTRVEVQCWITNTTGMTSADPALYMFKYNGTTAFAISNVFANGDPLGTTPAKPHDLDPQVPKCEQK